MAIRVRGSSFQVDVGLAGRRVRHTAGTKAEALKVEGQIQAWLHEGWEVDAIKKALGAGTASVPKGATTMGRLYELACVEWDTQVRGGNRDRAKGLLTELEWWQEDAEKMDTNRIMKGLTALQDAKGWSKATVNRYVAALSKMFACGVSEGLLVTSPKLKQRKEGVTRIRWLSEAEEARILSYWELVGDMEMYHLTVIMLDLGLRNSEALAISAEDIKNGHLQFYRQKVGQEAFLPMSQRSQDSLRAVTRFSLGSRAINAKWQRMAESLGLKDVTPYTLRHTKCTRLVMSGMNLFAVKAWMGHSSLSTTERYAHFDGSLLMSGVNL